MRIKQLCALAIGLALAALPLSGCKEVQNSAEPPTIVVDGPVAPELIAHGYKPGTALLNPGYAGYTLQGCDEAHPCGKLAAYAYVTLDGKELNAVEGPDDLRCAVEGKYRNFDQLSDKEQVAVLQVPYNRSNKIKSLVGDKWACAETAGPEK